MSNIQAAIDAVLKGFTIFPVEPGAKTPHRLYPNKPKETHPYTIKWSEQASSDMTQVVKWWTISPMANIGVACKQSSLLVLDCDAPKAQGQLRGTPFEYLHDKFGPLVDGTDVLRELCTEQFGQSWDELYDTYRVCTTRMGLHLYYHWPDDVKASQASIVNGILDVRSNGGMRGGYVLGAGSIVGTGAYVAENSSAVRPAPAWLVQLLTEKPRAAAAPREFARPGSGNFSGLVETVRNAPDGNLNNSLLWASRAMYEDGATLEEAVDLLAPVYVECNGRGGQRQAESTIRSGFRLQREKMG